ncbi:MULTISPECIES: hypothetical protein [Pseudomonadota]|uniref:Uncharacterized protein n=1 Tax=Pusillimonas minor TaxID=2697024 RepID=A0A842HUI9_9BURK|nr:MULTISPECIES: hypothetical protein [Pseudomonadota]MBC2771090.1 hypothetical protein [Pusillimonas minor]WRS33906.1 hypothetical protein U9S62_30410 [Pseudomonas aeruginosa]WRS34447.1 hypothetical protein U9S62_33230 [Pseudomonas aeruginosa]
MTGQVECKQVVKWSAISPTAEFSALLKANPGWQISSIPWIAALVNHINDASHRSEHGETPAEDSPPSQKTEKC